MPPGVLGNGLSALLRLLGSFFFYATRTSSITQSRGAGTPTETRATVATVMGYGPAGTIAGGQELLTVASGELRHQGARRISEGVWSTVDADGVPIPAAELKGEVIEAAATNLWTKPQEFDDVAWTKNAGVTIDPNTVVAPDGTLTGDTLVGATGADRNTLTLLRTTIGLTSSAAYTPGFYVISAGSTTVTLYARDVSTGTVSSTTLLLTSEWQRISVTKTLGAATTGANVYLGNADGDVGIWGAQLELGSYATAYIPTTTAAVTRNKDVLDDQVASNLTATAGSVAFQWTPSHAPSGTVALCGSYVDASNYTILLHDATDYIFRKRIAGTNYDATLTASFTSGTTYSVAVTWGASGSQIAVDGVLGTAHANTTAAQLGTRCQWGSDGNGGQQAGAAFKDMYLSPESMSDSELQTITR